MAKTASAAPAGGRRKRRHPSDAKKLKEERRNERREETSPRHRGWHQWHALGGVGSAWHRRRKLSARWLRENDGGIGVGQRNISKINKHRFAPCGIENGKTQRKMARGIIMVKNQHHRSSGRRISRQQRQHRVVSGDTWISLDLAWRMSDAGVMTDGVWISAAKKTSGAATMAKSIGKKRHQNNAQAARNDGG